jgi:hypothetical protein
MIKNGKTAATFTLIILVLRILEQEDPESEAILGYIMRPISREKQKQRGNIHPTFALKRNAKECFLEITYINLKI